MIKSKAVELIGIETLTSDFFINLKFDKKRVAKHSRTKKQNSIRVINYSLNAMIKDV